MVATALVFLIARCLAWTVGGPACGMPTLLWAIQTYLRKRQNHVQCLDHADFARCRRSSMFPRAPGVSCSFLPPPAVRFTVAQAAPSCDRGLTGAIKITGACTLAHERFPYRDIWDPLGRIFDALWLRPLLVGHRLDTRGQIADLQGWGRGIPRYQLAVRWRPRQADGRRREPRLRLVAVEGLSAGPERDPRLRRRGHRMRR